MSTRETDAAAELVELGRRLAEISPTTEQTFIVLARHTGLQPNSFDTLSLFSAVGERISKFASFVREVNDPFVDGQTRQHVLAALARFAGIFQPVGLGARWDQTKANHLLDQDIIMLSLFSRTARAHRPLKKLEDDELNMLSERLGPLCDELRAGSDVPEWVRQPLIEGLERLRLTLRLLPFFGYDAAIEHLILLDRSAKALEQAIVNTPGEHKSALAKILKVAEVVVVIAELFCAPHHVTAALQHYRHWEMVTIIGNKPAEPRLIEGPKAPQEGPHANVDNATEAVINL